MLTQRQYAEKKLSENPGITTIEFIAAGKKYSRAMKKTTWKSSSLVAAFYASRAAQKRTPTITVTPVLPISFSQLLRDAADRLERQEAKLKAIGELIDRELAK